MNHLTVDLIVNDVRSRMAVQVIPTDEPLPRWTATLLRPTADGVFVSDPAGRVVDGMTAGEVVGVMAGFVTAGALDDIAADLRSVAAPAVVERPSPSRPISLPPRTASAPVPVAAAESAPMPIAAESAPDLVRPAAPDATTAPTSFASAQDRPAEMRSATEDAVARLADELAAGHTQGFLDFLAFSARFWTYSVGNQLLIRMQRPTATRVAGLRRWNDLGYRVRRGETAAFIWAPIVRKLRDQETGEVGEDVVGFRAAGVFSEDQLEGIDERPLPSPYPVLPDDVEDLYRQVVDRIRAHGIVVEERALPPGVRGASAGGAIAIAPGLGSRDRLAVLLHELGHELGEAHHGPDRDAKPREIKEAEAEAAAHVVAAVLGVDVPGSQDYLLNWACTPEELRRSLQVIQRLVKACLAVVMPTEGERLPAAA